MISKQQSFKSDAGKLYLVPTPIGNLEDLSVRSLKILQQADLIASEDTRNTQKLLNHFEISTSQISLHEHNYKERIPQLLAHLRQGAMIAQVSDAGMPSISDPGHELVVACLAEEIDVISLPGPTAGLTALIASGLLPQPNLFLGFLPRKMKEVKDLLEPYLQHQVSMIFYESPHRIKKTLGILAQIFKPECQVCLARELTKVHEEYLRGSLQELADQIDNYTLKGEMCLIIENIPQTKSPAEASYQQLPLKEQVENVMNNEQLSSKEAIKKIAKLNNLKKQEVYQAYHEL